MKRLLLLICGLLIFSPVVGFADEYPTQPMNQVVDADGELSESAITLLSTIAQEMKDEDGNSNYYFVFKNVESYKEMNEYVNVLDERWAGDNTIVLISLDNLYVSFSDNSILYDELERINPSEVGYDVSQELTKDELSIRIANVISNQLDETYQTRKRFALLLILGTFSWSTAIFFLIGTLQEGTDEWKHTLLISVELALIPTLFMSTYVSYYMFP